MVKSSKRKDTSNRSVAGRQEHQNSRPYQRQNATSECDSDRREYSRFSTRYFDIAGKTVLADFAYSCQAIRDYLKQRGAVVCILDKSTFKTKHNFDSELYKQRNKVERFFLRIKNFRHIATRFDKLALCFKNFILLAAFVIHF